MEKLCSRRFRAAMISRESQRKRERARTPRIPRRCQSCVCPSLSDTWSYPPVSSKCRRCRRAGRRPALLLTSRNPRISLLDASSSRIQIQSPCLATMQTVRATASLQATGYNKRSRTRTNARLSFSRASTLGALLGD